jgi:hypothetical protein
MRLIFFGIIVLLASTGAVHCAQVEKHGYAQARTGHWQPTEASRDELIDVDQGRPQADALTKRIEQDNMWLDRLIEICPSC